MIGSLILAVAVALVSYTILPALSKAWFRQRRKRLAAYLGAGTAGFCAGAGRDGIRFVPAGAPVAAGSAAAEQVSIPPGKAIIFRITDAGITELPGSKLRQISVHTPMILAQQVLPFRRRLAAVAETGNRLLEPDALMERLNAPGDLTDPLRYVWAAAGIFTEFLFFITWLGAYSTPLPALAAMIAIFGKALPWCPPGLFLTLAAHRLSAPRRTVRRSQNDRGTAGNLAAIAQVEGKKKDRQRRAVGLLLIAVGVVLNLAAIFLGIRQSGWIPF